MALHKRKLHGKIVWRYKFDAPGSTRENRIIIEKSGFASKEAARNGEAERRVEEQQKFELAKAGSGVAASPPKTLKMLLEEFLRQHAEEKLSPTTVQGYRNKLALLDAELLAMSLFEITPLHLSREWTRLLKSGGRDRKTKERRPLGRKTVREVAGMVSAAFNRGIIWRIATGNPVKASEPPVPKKHKACALTVAQQDLLIESATGPWCIKAFLRVCAALGARRGEVLALRWSDIQDGRASIERSLIQTRAGLQFKGTKTETPRTVVIPAEALETLELHRKQQDGFRRQFGPAYRSDLDLIFCNPDGTPLKPDSLSSTIGELFSRLGIPKPKGSSLHLLRHTHVSHLLASDVPVPAVAARLGHSSIRTTLDIYGHMIHGQDEEAVRKWEQYQRENRAANQASKTVQ
jgi:integrase